MLQFPKRLNFNSVTIKNLNRVYKLDYITTKDKTLHHLRRVHTYTVRAATPSILAASVGSTCKRVSTHCDASAYLGKPAMENGNMRRSGNVFPKCLSIFVLIASAQCANVCDIRSGGGSIVCNCDGNMTSEELSTAFGKEELNVGALSIM